MMKRSITLAVLTLPIALWSCRTNDAGTQTATTTTQAVTSSTETMAPPPQTASASPVQTPPPAQPAPAVEDDLTKAARITVPELQQKVAANSAVIVDVRPAEAYKESHILGAINIPLSELAQRVGELPKDKFIAAYCT